LHDNELNYSTEYPKKSFNPYYLQLVESNIEIANTTSEDKDLSAYRAARKLVLEYFEPQYQLLL